jgi:3-deoxy-manno-octulosonate cytidylyltransferase (CMP-KDO synthetase)
MIQWVYEQAARAKSLDRVIVATDNTRIMRAVWSFGGEAMLTSKRCRTGTDRVAEVTRRMAADIVVNIQGDEPLIEAKTIDATVQPMLKDSRLLMSTAAAPVSEEESRSPNLVKVIMDQQDNALYFSRSPIPFYRNPGARRPYYQHFGIYAYRRAFLLRFAKQTQTPLEIAESLEQLRALERGIRIRVVLVNQTSIGVDTREDLEKVQKLLAKKSK